MSNTIRQVLKKTQFITSANDLDHLPPSRSEIAFAGRSNAGKSSALNLITGQKGLARTSKTPGRTQLINFFEVAEELFLVDLPGYGFAKVPERIKAHWQGILQGYFESRESLDLLIMLMDVRHPLTPLDLQMINWCEAANLPTHILLTKADKLTRNHANKSLHEVQKEIELYDVPITAQLFSAVKPDIGLDAVHSILGDWYSHYQSTADDANLSEDSRENDNNGESSTEEL